jgi:prepilin-type N-terminal cleavage/methylation domain-containing protein
VVRAARRRARGFTLIEVLIALLVATVGLLGALALTGVLVRGAVYARNLSEASQLAQSKLEELVLVKPMPIDGTTADPNNPMNAFGVKGAESALYTRAWTWSTYVDADTTGTRRVILVTVSWPDSAGFTHTITAERHRVP